MSTGKPRGGSQVLPTVIALILVVVGLITLNLGLSTLSNDLPTAILYLSVAVVSFGFVSFSLMRVRRGFSLPFLSNSRVLSIVLCTKCSFKQIKNFTLGDYVFKQEGKCTQCGNLTLYINGIYSESLKKA